MQIWVKEGGGVLRKLRKYGRGQGGLYLFVPT